MKYVLLLMILLTGCTGQTSSFITVDVLRCMKLTQLYHASSLASMNAVDLASEECAIVNQDFRIRKDLIRTFSPKFSVRTEFAVPNPTADSPIKITQINVEHCEVNTEKSSADVVGTCAELEKQL